mmetsp:Transcript_109807/g.251804  ORF Transcript_109807/g.251804 Transcript_109807/m.251804 type:complete len:266 (+) Transcript_109807:729-1526(+)
MVQSRCIFPSILGPGESVHTDIVTRAVFGSCSRNSRTKLNGRSNDSSSRSVPNVGLSRNSSTLCSGMSSSSAICATARPAFISSLTRRALRIRLCDSKRLTFFLLCSVGSYSSLLDSNVTPLSAAPPPIKLPWKLIAGLQHSRIHTLHLEKSLRCCLMPSIPDTAKDRRALIRNGMGFGPKHLAANSSLRIRGHQDTSTLITARSPFRTPSCAVPETCLGFPIGFPSINTSCFTSNFPKCTCTTTTGTFSSSPKQNRCTMRSTMP